MSTEHVERRLTAILAADISGYSRLMGNDEEGTLAQLKAHRRALVDRKINEHRGRIVKTTGDGMLIEFASVVEAVRCAVEIQRGMAERNVAVPAGQRIEFRVGINVGDIIIEDDDIFGDGVNVAARLEGLAEPGGICVSGRVQEDVQGKLDIAFEDIGEQKLKNIARPVRAFRVRLDATAAPAPAGWLRGLFAALALMILLIVGALWAGLGSEWKFLSILRSGDQFTKSAEVSTKPAIAILPFLNQSDDSARQYFADGLTQDIINALGRFSALTVMSWNAVFPYKGKPASPEEIGRGLAVSYLVEGSVRQTGDRVRVIAQLVDTRQGRVIWSARFEEALADVFALQDNIVTRIVRVLAIRVTQIEQNRVFAKPTENLAAYDYVLRARPALQSPTHANNVEARALLRRAIELDPNYAAAYAALAETYHIASSMGWAESPTAFLSRAEELAIKALSLDDSDVRARITLGHIHLFRQRYNQAEVEIERAIAINPNDAHGLAGRGTILLWLGQTDAAIEALEQAQRIDPDLNAIDRFALSLAYYLKRRYDAAIEQAELSLRTTAGANFSRILLAAAYAQVDRAEDAARVVTMIRRIDPTFDPQEFGTKFLSSGDLEHLRDGFRKARLYPVTGDLPPAERMNR
ncbi:TolB amino-terminal domain-containing protein [Mesorhizobium muleiense]|uniref:TolB amino-terminal domain-containing protein n=1 Tax=Mesorhizobium muleiense TaxID=1004279 RepID=A0A1G8JRU3_9HYPH|nr:TolB amino-terminal domain-containing protein [Mesorhizobium muleiense]